MSRDSQADALDDLARPCAVRAAAREPQREADVLLDRQRRQQIEGLEDEADALAPERRALRLAEAADVDASEPDAAGGRRVQAGRAVQERALAGARRAHDGGEAAAAKPERHAVEGDDGAFATAVDLADLIEADGVGERPARHLHGLVSGRDSHAHSVTAGRRSREGPGRCPALPAPWSIEGADSRTQED